MWNSKEIIRIELGADIIKASNSPDTRDWLERILGLSTPHNDAQLLIDGICAISNRLSKEGITLPHISLHNNDEIPGDEFICFWGIEKCHYSITTHSNLDYELVEGLLNFIEDKAKLYHCSEKDVDSYLSDAINMLRQDNIQKAYEDYLRAYYVYKQNGNFYSCMQILSEVAAIVARDGQFDLAAVFVDQAVSYCNMANIVDTNLKCQIYMNAASIYKNIDYNKSFDYLNKCYQAASLSNNQNFKFLSLLGFAENNSILGGYEIAIKQYKEALSMLNPNYSNIACGIYEQIVYLYDVLLSKIQQNNRTKEIILKMSIKIIRSVLDKLLEVAFYKLFKIDGRLSLFSFGNTINASNISNSRIFAGNNNLLN